MELRRICLNWKLSTSAIRSGLISSRGPYIRKHPCSIFERVGSDGPLTNAGKRISTRCAPRRLVASDFRTAWSSGSGGAFTLGMAHELSKTGHPRKASRAWVFSYRLERTKQKKRFPQLPHRKGLKLKSSLSRSFRCERPVLCELQSGHFRSSAIAVVCVFFSFSNVRWDTYRESHCFARRHTLRGNCLLSGHCNKRAHRMSGSSRGTLSVPSIALCWEGYRKLCEAGITLHSWRTQ